MDPVSGFFIVAGLTTLLAAAVAFVIRKPLGRILVEICGSEDRGRFWQVFSYVFLVLSALAGTLLVPPESRGTRGGASLDFQACLASFRAGVLGLLLSLGAMGCVMIRAILAQPRSTSSSPAIDRLSSPPSYPPR